MNFPLRNNKKKKKNKNKKKTEKYLIVFVAISIDTFQFTKLQITNLKNAHDNEKINKKNKQKLTKEKI